MSDTPRTDAMRGFHDLDTAVDAEFAEQLERELNAANERIKRMEREIELLRHYSDYTDVILVDSILRGEEIARKEAKP